MAFRVSNDERYERVKDDGERFATEQQVPFQPCALKIQVARVASTYSFCMCSTFIVRFSCCSLLWKPCCRDLARPVPPPNFVCIVIIGAFPCCCLDVEVYVLVSF